MKRVASASVPVLKESLRPTVAATKLTMARQSVAAEQRFLFSLSLSPPHFI